MKTLKFALIAALVACTMMSLAYADGFKEKPKAKKVINLTLQQAVKIPGLVTAMYQQIDKEELLNGTQHIYMAEVTYQGTLYRITGTLDQWIRFFRSKWVMPVDVKGKVIGVG